MLRYVLDLHTEQCIHIVNLGTYNKNFNISDEIVNWQVYICQSKCMKND